MAIFAISFSAFCYLLSYSMKKTKETYDKILWECFKLFLQKSYKEVTIPDMENAIGMTRGAIFYYVKDKKELFKAVVDRYLLEKQNVNNKISQKQITGLLRFIITYIEGINKTQQSLNPLPDEENTLYSYMNLTHSALLYYEGFKEQALHVLELEVSLWVKVLTAAKESGEIRENINVSIAAKKFQRLFYGHSYLSGINSHFDTAELLEIYIDEYNLIKS